SSGSRRGGDPLANPKTLSRTWHRTKFRLGEPMKLCLTLTLLLFLSFGASAQEETITLRFRVEPPTAEVYRTGSARDTQQDRATLLCTADREYLIPLSELPKQLQLLFSAPGYQDKLQSFDLTNASNYTEITLPQNGDVIVLESARNNYIPHALVLV